MTDKITSPAVPSSISETNESKFKGYTLEDIRYRRAVVALQKEFAKSKIASSTHKIQRHSPFSKNFANDRTPAGKVGALATKLVSGLNYLDYAMIGYSVFNTGRKLIKFLRRKK